MTAAPVIRPQELAPGVQGFATRTATLPPATHTNSYALGSRDVLLVEPATPYVDEQREWLDWARSLASQGRNLLGLLLTHHHIDHVAGAEAFSQELGLPIWAHEETAGKLEGLKVTRHLKEDDELILAGPSPQRWQVLHTPGHAHGHLCFLETTSKHLVVGDMVASVGTILIEPGDGHMTTYLNQLERLAELNATCALPAHGDPVDDPAGLFRFYIQHRLKRERAVLAALDAKPGPQTLDELLPVAYGDTPEFLWPLARLSLEAHLIRLIDEGRATRADDCYCRVDQT